MSGASFMGLVSWRSSVRRYDPDRQIPEEALREMLEAGRLAPSAENSQPWRFIVVRNADERRRFSRECFSGIFSATRFASEAPLLIALCADRLKILERAGEAVLKTALYQLDCGIAGEHLVLSAAGLGIGSCWIGWFDKRKARRLLKLPARVEPVCLIAFGYPAPGMGPREKRRAPLSQIAFENEWGKPLS